MSHQSAGAARCRAKALKHAPDRCATSWAQVGVTYNVTLDNDLTAANLLKLDIKLDGIIPVTVQRRA